MTTDPLAAFVAAVGPDGPVTVVGGRTHWDVGGPPDPAAREVVAPAGVVEHRPEEMIVRVRAGTTVAELDAALAERGQLVALDPEDPERATVGGVLAVGRSGIRRLRYGALRDALLEARFVSSEGRLLRAGAPVVKNVSGYDLCRLLVGSLGTLGLFAEVVLRCQPRPAASAWLRAEGADPFGILRRLYRPSAVLTDGAATWVLLEGHPDDVAAERSVLGPSFEPVEGPPPRPAAARRSLPPGSLRALVRTLPPGSFLAEVGVGVLHLDDPATVPPPPPPEPALAALHRAVKARFDPCGRLNPGRRVVAA
jgi:FAD/FMN-containing dehydrogenase